MPPTLDYYNQNAKDYAAKTFDANVSTMLHDFASKLPAHGAVLDVGCGSGRDTLAFLNRGFNVTAFDASIELAKIACQAINHPVHVTTIENMAWEDEFDGVWAMASLLHLRKDQLLTAITSCARALKSTGAGQFFASFKLGDGEGIDDKGRFFSYYQKDELQQLFESTRYFDCLQISMTEDSLGRPELSWLCVVAHLKSGLDFSRSIAT